MKRRFLETALLLTALAVATISVGAMQSSKSSQQQFRNIADIQLPEGVLHVYASPDGQSFDRLEKN